MSVIDVDAILYNDARDMLPTGGYVSASYIDNRPIIEAEPVRHGRWVPVGKGTWHSCSVCNGIPLRGGKGEDVLSDYCPNCGAKMDGGCDENR